MFKRKGGSRGNLRRKQTDSGSEDESSEKKEANGGAALTHVDSRPSNLLSFGEDMDNNADEFKIKKSSRSRRMEKFRKQIEKERNGNEEEAEESSGAQATSLDDVQMEKVVKVKDEPPQIIKPEPEIIEEEPPDPFKQALKVAGGQIPDAQMVFLARKQRARAREGGDVIAMSKPEETKRYKKSDRLVREDDENDPSDDDDHGKFYSKKENLKEIEEEKKMLQAQFLQVEQGDSDAEQDDDFDRWEMEQIKKAVSGQKMSTIQRDYERGSEFAAEWNLRPEVREPQPMDLDVQVIDDDDMIRLTKRKKNKNVPKYGGGSMSDVEKGMSLSEHLKKMKLQLDATDQVNRSKDLEIEKLQSHLDENNESVSKLEATIPLCSKQYSLFQELQNYCRDLLECLNEKVPEIDRIENEVLHLLKNRTEFVQKRHRQDIKDEFEACSVSADRKALLASDATKGMRTADREARRTRRRQAREKGLKQGTHRDGDSSDDEFVPSQIQAFNNDHAKFSSEAEKVLEDADDEFSTIQSILLRFSRWFLEDRGSFEEAYINLCVQKLIAPLVRLQMIAWNPLDESCKPLDSFGWFQDLLLFLPVDNNESPCDVDTAANLIPLVVEKVVIPKLTNLIRNAWDPTSTTQTKQLTLFLNSLLQYPAVCCTSKQVQGALTALHDKAKTSLDDDLFMPIYSKETIMTVSTGAKAFVYRQFWFAFKVLRNILSFDGFLSSAIVQELCMDGIVNRQLVLGMQCADQSDPAVFIMAKTVFDALPMSWYKENGRSLKKQFEPLAKVLCSIGEESYYSRTDDSSAKEIYKMLNKLRATEYAARYRDKINLKV